jgi:hypothetical protein
LRQKQPPQITYGASGTGDFDSYAWCVLPSSTVVTGNPNGETGLQRWCDQTLENPSPVPPDTVSTQTIWTYYGFKPISTSISMTEIIAMVALMRWMILPGAGASRAGIKDQFMIMEHRAGDRLRRRHHRRADRLG